MVKYVVVGAVVMVGLIGCGRSESTQQNTPPAGLPEGVLVKEAPKDARPVAQVVAEARDGEEVVLFGRVGGRKEPFVKDRAVMLVIDPSVQSCADKGEACPEPWDFCCETPDQMTRHTVTVQVVDAGGRPLRTGLQDAGGLRPLSGVTVRGKIHRSPDGKAMVVNASQLHVSAAGR